jgi:hypothetical protein
VSNGEELKVAVERHEEVKKLHIRGHVHESQRQEQNDLERPNHAPELAHQQPTTEMNVLELTRGIGRLGWSWLWR